jgi:hypothetical protein
MKKPYLTFAIVVTTLLLSGTQSTIVDLYNNLFATIETAIDWGIIFIALAILALMFLILRGKTRSVFRNWNKLLGGIALGFAAWGILAFSSPTENLGGTFGLGIIGARDFLGALRIFGLLIIGIILFLPKVTALLSFKKVAVPSNLNSSDSQQRHPEQTKDAASDNTEYVQTNAKSSPGFKLCCRNCGKELSGTPVYCRYCGVKARVESKFCPTCGSPTYDTADFCTKCGTSLR